jgi:hemoglobin
VRQIVDRFYDLMDEDPAYAELRAMHSADLAPMRDSLTGFMVGWSGGPRDWFAQGKCVMSLHAPLGVTAQTARQWLEAMARAIDETVGGRDPEIAKAMNDVLQQMAHGMAR